MTQTKNSDAVAVVGGGLAGLSAAGRRPEQR